MHIRGPDGLNGSIRCGILCQNDVQSVAIPAAFHHISTNNGNVGNVNKVGFHKVRSGTDRFGSCHNGLDHIGSRILCFNSHGQGTLADQDTRGVEVTNILRSISGIFFAVDLPVGDQTAKAGCANLENLIVRSRHGQSSLLTSLQHNLVTLRSLIQVRQGTVDVAHIVGQIEGNGNVGVFHDLLNTNNGDLQIFGDGGNGNVAGFGGNGLAVDLHGEVGSCFKAFFNGNVEGIAIGCDGLAGDGIADAGLRYWQDSEMLTVAQLVGQGEDLFATVRHNDGHPLAVFVIQVDQTDGNGSTVGRSLFQSQTHNDLTVLLGLAVAIVGNTVNADHPGLDIGEVVHIGHILGIGDQQAGGTVGDFHQVVAILFGDGDDFTLVGEHIGELGTLGDHGAGCAADGADIVIVAVASCRHIAGLVLVAADTLVQGVAAGGTGGVYNSHFVNTGMLNSQTLQSSLVDGRGQIFMGRIDHLEFLTIGIQGNAGLAALQNGENSFPQLAVASQVFHFANHDGTRGLIVSGIGKHFGYQEFLAPEGLGGKAFKLHNRVIPDQVGDQSGKAGVILQSGSHGDLAANIQSRYILHIAGQGDLEFFRSKYRCGNHTNDQNDGKDHCQCSFHTKKSFP